MTSPSHRSSLGALLLVAVIPLAACQSASEEASPSPSDAVSVAPSASASTEPSLVASPSPSEAAGNGEEVSVFDIEVGDCFSAGADQIESVIVVDCEQPHVYEAFRIFDHEAGPDGEYPGDDVIREYADTACQPAFEEFVEHDYRTSIWYITSITPSSDTWAGGDREIVCTLNQQDESELTGSAEGAAE